MAGPWEATLGAVTRGKNTRFRVWAPDRELVELELYESDGSARHFRMSRSAEGYWTCSMGMPRAGRRYLYRYRLDGDASYPDPCSRSQPQGVHGPSETVDPGRFAWSDADWQPPEVADLVTYECHIGTLTKRGTFDSAIEQLPRLRSIGINAIEVMPVAAFPGRWSWGYDGVALFAPSEVYGGPGGFRRLVDAAHANGIAVILDVVYNHFGPSGNYTGMYSSGYLTDRYPTPWGDAVNFDGPGSDEVRTFVRENLLHWLHEYHIDGFRFDATHAIFDRQERHILAELSDSVHHWARDEHVPYLFAESHENDPKYVVPTANGGFGFDGVWADDFHHVVRTILHRDRDGYFASYEGSVEELARTVEQGFYFEGQVDPWPGEPRGNPAREQPWRQFVYAIQNHDQIGNRAFGQRLNVTAASEDFLSASLLLLLLPQTPLVFQGQEFMATSAFLYFTDHEPELGRLVTEGRRSEFARFRAFSDPVVRERIPDPQDPTTFLRSKLPLDESAFGIGMLCQDLYAAATAIRASDPVLHAARRERAPIHTRVVGKAVLIEIEAAGSRRLIVVNFGEEARFPLDGEWSVALSTAEARFGGNGDEMQFESGELVVLPRMAAFLTPSVR
ncbi:MAG: malto-oligosyltrehalose trehalohydrolase [Tepidiformaceae bacterium]